MNNIQIAKSSKRKILQWLVLFVITLICFAYYTLVLINKDRPIHSDDSETPIHFFQLWELGEPLPIKTVLRFFSVFNLLNYVVYAIFGYGVFSTILVFGIRFAICLFLSFFLILSVKNKLMWDWWILPIAVFLIIFQNRHEPGILSSEFHTDPLIPFLLFLVLIQYYSLKGKNKVYFLLLALITVFEILQVDFLMLPIYFIPLCCLIFFQNVERIKLYSVIKKSLPYICLCIGIVFIIVFLFPKISSSFSGYGARVFSTPNDIVKNINFTILGIADMFNAQIAGVQIISLETMQLVFRSCLVLAFMVIAVLNCRRIVRAKDGEIDSVNLMCSISIIAIILVYILSGPQELYNARYLSAILFLGPILLCRTIVLNCNISNHKIKILYGLSFGLMCVGFCDKSVFNIDLGKNKEYHELIQVYETLNGENLQYGIGEFWTANVLTQMSNYEQKIQAVSWNANNSQLDSYMYEWSFYSDKCNYTNYIIQDKDLSEFQIQPFGINYDTVSAVYGQPEKVISVANRNIFIYDYDIRTAPIKIPCTIESLAAYQGVNENNSALQMLPQSYYKIEVPEIEIGTYYIDVSGNGLENNLELLSSNADITVIESTSNNIRYEVTLNNYTLNNYFEFKNIGKENIQVESMAVKTVKEALELKSNGKSMSSVFNQNQYITEIECDNFNLNKGTYKIIVKGDKIKNIKILFSDLQDSSLILNNIKKGNSRVVYEVDILEDNTKLKLGIYNLTKDVQIDGVYVEVMDMNNR